MLVQDIKVQETVSLEIAKLHPRGANVPKWPHYRSKPLPMSPLSAVASTESALRGHRSRPVDLHANILSFI